MNDKIQAAITDLCSGKMVLLLDDHDRENEADLVMAGQFVQSDDITFMRDHSCGIICLSMSQGHAKRLNIPLMTVNNDSNHQTPFGVSFEAAIGVTTGVSSADRAHTIRVASRPEASMNDIVMPGHVFPLLAHEHGVFGRQGHTEGSVDLMRLAGVSSTAAICEVMLADGTMARGSALVEFAQRHQLSVLSIQDIIEYRLQSETWLRPVSESRLPTRHGDFKIIVFQSDYDQKEHVALCSAQTADVPLVRIHSECLTGDVFASTRCDCGQQLDLALTMIAQQGGAILYCRQEGRGIGFANKIKAYALQDQGFDTVEANQRLGFATDCRNYSAAVQMLKYLQWQKIRLLTNNPQKVAAMQAEAIEVVDRVPIEVQSNEQNSRYLQTKRDKLGHLLQVASVS